MTKKKEPLSGDITTRRKADKVRIIREPKVVLCTQTAEEAIKLAHSLMADADKILQATGELEE